jgi:hypothetical protein
MLIGYEKNLWLKVMWVGEIDERLSKWAEPKYYHWETINTPDIERLQY